MANDCALGISQDIISNCTTQPTGGLEVEAYIINRSDIASITFDATNPSKFTAITLNTGKRAFKLTGVNKNMQAGSELSKTEELSNTYIHKWMFKGFQFDSASVENMDALDDLVVIYQRKDTQINADGVFQCLGLRTGLYTNADTFNTNELNGIRSIEMQSEEQQTEPYSIWTFLATDVAGSKAALAALLIPAV